MVFLYAIGFYLSVYLAPYANARNICSFFVREIRTIYVN